MYIRPRPMWDRFVLTSLLSPQLVLYDLASVDDAWVDDTVCVHDISTLESASCLIGVNWCL